MLAFAAAVAVWAAQEALPPEDRRPRIAYTSMDPSGPPEIAFDEDMRVAGLLAQDPNERITVVLWRADGLYRRATISTEMPEAELVEALGPPSRVDRAVQDGADMATLTWLSDSATVWTEAASGVGRILWCSGTFSTPRGIRGGMPVEELRAGGEMLPPLPLGDSAAGGVVQYVRPPASLVPREARAFDYALVALVLGAVALTVRVAPGLPRPARRQLALVACVALPVPYAIWVVGPPWARLELLADLPLPFLGPVVLTALCAELACSLWHTSPRSWPASARLGLLWVVAVAGGLMGGPWRLPGEGREVWPVWRYGVIHLWPMVAVCAAAYLLARAPWLTEGTAPAPEPGGDE